LDKWIGNNNIINIYFFVMQGLSQHKIFRYINI